MWKASALEAAQNVQKRSGVGVRGWGLFCNSTFARLDAVSKSACYHWRSVQVAGRARFKGAWSGGSLVGGVEHGQFETMLETAGKL
eukprot:696529-Rhodomonas_salina.1